MLGAFWPRRGRCAGGDTAEGDHRRRARSQLLARPSSTGAVNPNGSDTSYYFQYGLTKAYGSQTAIADAGAGSKALPVRLAISGLQPLTVYHYRLVAVNSAGATIGDDEKLLTTKVPLSLAILASPNPVSFGGTVTVQGTLSGTGNANRAVVLQANAFPFTAGFQNDRQHRADPDAGGGLQKLRSRARPGQRRSSACHNDEQRAW